MGDIFNLNRLIHLMMNDLRLQAKIILIVTAAIGVFIALIPYHIAGTLFLYFFILYLGGLVITSQAFNDLHDRRKAHLFLILPCSALERFLSKWLFTTVGYALASLLVYYVFCFLNVIINEIVFHRHIALLNVFSPALWIGILKYISFQAIFLFGSIFFKRFSLIKTLLTIGCFFLALGIISILVTWISCPECARHNIMIHTSFTDQSFIFWIISAPIFWWLTYLRLTQSELI